MRGNEYPMMMISLAWQSCACACCSSDRFDPLKGSLTHVGAMSRCPFRFLIGQIGCRGSRHMILLLPLSNQLTEPWIFRMCSDFLRPGFDSSHLGFFVDDWRADVWNGPWP
jgi:hypothetical protein